MKRTPKRATTSARAVTPALLRRLPLPPLDHAGDKESRGRILAVGGCVQVPGAMLLAGVAALRAGAGKLQLATVRAAALPLGLAVPEALVVGLPTSAAGEIAGARAAAPLREHAAATDALLVGPGMTADRAAHALLAALVPRLRDDAVLVLDGAAVVALRHDEALLAPLGGRVVLTPHSGEMASLLDVARDAIEADAPEVARTAAARFGATVALKGAESWIAAPDGTLLHYRGNAVGLGTSGSGDTLAGIVAGLAARGASATTAAAWGVWAHGTAGRILARRTATVGFLARELLAEVPALVGRA
ncbi:NAD(P)H-hydrate dehydratase [Roseisolibacter agri]|uniref:ADP-dependent (S)-NAD(P)H-hydrate dehydratase n=1 Tax=Roseisolibacter agri TaxID=2014610 RepID=A0AA37QDD8_9BACT|nr:NAD(P)H-hydrate dehydratase [Roseisolibacter agri]GLC26841.1 ADP-dependent (S)-NAD(P)H-hydrate dehydratase [Roseisolibacter agri]